MNDAKLPRARQCGVASTSAIVGTGASGTRLRCPSSSIAAADSLATAGIRIASSASAAAMRKSVVSYRLSRANSGIPTTSHSPCHCCGVSAEIPIHPSRAGKIVCGYTGPYRFTPRRRVAGPPANRPGPACSARHKNASWMLTSTRAAPAPRRRPSNAAIAAMNPVAPPTTCGACPCGSTGGPSAVPKA